MHTNPSQLCNSCVEMLLECHESLKIWIEIITDTFKDCHIAVGFRNEVDQNLALEKKLTHAPWPKSKHNRMEGNIPRSWAVDLFRLDAQGVAYFEKHYYEQIWAFIESIQAKINDQEVYWGGLFSNLKDYDHFELLKIEISEKLEVISQDSC